MLLTEDIVIINLLYDGQGVKVVVYCEGKKNVIDILKKKMVVVNNERERALRLVSAKINRAPTTCEIEFCKFCIDGAT